MGGNPFTAKDISKFLAKTISGHELNVQEDGEQYFGEPLVGFAAADDPLFSKYKTLIGPHHLTPAEAFEEAHKDALPSGATVISWSLPIAKVTRKEQRKEKRLPCRRWARTRWYGQMMNDELARLLIAFLMGKGVRSAAPAQLPSFMIHSDSPSGISSTWSERHAAYAAGLGTFSINDALITEHGIAHRLGSVVAEMSLEPSKRKKNHRGNCLFVMRGGCLKCAKRCPVKAISKKGHDKVLCEKYSYGTVLKKVGDKFDVKVSGCGLCQTDVPCEKRIPKGIKD